MLNIKKSEGITIDQNHRVFEDSDFQDYEFQITIKPLTKSEWLKFKKLCTTKSGLNNEMFSSKVFMEQVTGWKGLRDQDGNEIIYSQESKQILDENCMSFVTRIAATALDDIQQKEEIKKI